MKPKQILPLWVKIVAFAIGASLGIWNGIKNRPVSIEKQIIQEEQGRHA